MRTHTYDGRYIEAQPSRVVVVSRIARVFDFIFGVIDALLLVRFALEFFRARPQAGFVQFIHEMTAALYAPFNGIFAPTNWNGYLVVWSLLVAVVAYMVLHAAIRGVLGLLAR